jgi:uncharacterized protein (TIGR00730 family)
MDTNTTVPAGGIPTTPITLHQVEDEINQRLSRINKEFAEGFDLIKHQPKSVTVFGSARLLPESPYFKAAEELAYKLGRLGYSIITGGGPGIMQAANKGAKEAHTRSIGLNIKLPFEQALNPYVTHEMAFHYFFSRKVMMTFSAEAYVFFPGGFGTMDEFFEVLTLVQTGKIERVPLVLYGSEFWKPLYNFFTTAMLPLGTIAANETELFTVTDSIDDIVSLIKATPIRNGVRVHNEDTPGATSEQAPSQDIEGNPSNEAFATPAAHAANAANLHLSLGRQIRLYSNRTAKQIRNTTIIKKASLEAFLIV